MIRISVVTMIATLLAGAAVGQTMKTPPAPAASPPTMAAPATPAAPAMPAHPTATKSGADKSNQFADEASAKGHCAADTVVWVNTSSKVYHLSGTPDYGKTKKGAYMCQKDADQGGFHVAKGEVAKGSTATTPAMAPKKP